MCERAGVLKRGRQLLNGDKHLKRGYTKIEHAYETIETSANTVGGRSMPASSFVFGSRSYFSFLVHFTSDAHRAMHSA